MHPRVVSLLLIIMVTGGTTTLLPLAIASQTTTIVSGIFEIPTPGSKRWAFTLAADRQYAIAINIASAGPIPLLLVVQDPWGAAYTIVDGFFTQGKDTDAYAITFAAPESGAYSFTISTGVGPADAAEVMFGLMDQGPLRNSHATNTTSNPLVDARACNASYTAWSYAISLAGNSTYYLDVARGNPCSAKTNLNVTATIQAEDGSEVLVMGNTPLPWDVPHNATGQAMLWASTWFGVEAAGTYNIEITTLVLPGAPAAVVATTVAKIDHAGSNPARNSTNSTSNSTGSGIVIGSEGLAVIAGISATGLGVGMGATAATRRKNKGGAESGEVRRTSVFEEF